VFFPAPWPKPAVEFRRFRPEVDPEAPGDLENLRYRRLELFGDLFGTALRARQLDQFALFSHRPAAHQILFAFSPISMRRRRAFDRGWIIPRPERKGKGFSTQK
jgi:hypothetical protein